ncbi:MAG: type IV pilus secretin PilQ [Betaproteobacteria bacterium]|nr:type IV pilus secretin PilQ [Betaproteobacteria bacterium]
MSVSVGQNDTQVVKIAFTEALNEEPITFATSNPHRLVLDFPSTGSGVGRAPVNLNLGVIRNYQVVQAGDRTRVVFNLNGPTSHELRREGNTLLAVLRGAEKAASAQSAAVTPTVFPEAGTARAHGIRDVEFRRGDNGEARIVVSLSDPGVGIDIQQKGKSVQVDFLNTSLPKPLQRRLDVADFATPAQQVETFEQGKNTRMLVTPRGKWDYSAHQAGSQFIMELRSLEDPRAAKADKPVYTGEKLTLNFQNVEVRAVLQVIADFTGLNIIASDTVAGNVTLRLKDVPWDQALDIIMRAKGLDKRVSGNVIWVAPRDELIAKEKLELEARKSVAELEPLVTRSYPLNYLRANDAVAVVTGDSRSMSSSQDDATCSPSSTGIKADIVTGGSTMGGTSTTGSGGRSTTSNVNRVLSERGGATFDLTTNTLIVTDTPSRHAAVEDVLKNVDVPTRQVMIEARVVIADDNFNKDLGVRLGFTKSRTSGNVTGDAGFDVDLPRAGIVGAPQFELSLVNAASNFILDLEIRALEVNKKGKVVSNPRVVTTNLKPAVILQGTQIPYLSSSANTGTETEFKDALLCLLVAPQILNNDSVILNVEVTKDVPDTSFTPPAINVRRVKTQVRVNNGDTAILGGIFEQETEQGEEKMPILGDLPILGHLFKSRTQRDEKREMLIFLTPRIIDEGLASVR